MNIGVAYNPCSKCEEKSNCNICELTYYRKGALSMENKRTLAEIGIGESLKIAGIEFIKMRERDGIAEIYARKAAFNSSFGDNNNYSESRVKDRLEREILPLIEAEVGADNIIEQEVDLRSLTGSRAYGLHKCKISIPTFDYIRENYKAIYDDAKKIDCRDWSWTATPNSTTEFEEEDWVVCVSPGGGILNDGSRYDDDGVRPFLLLKSSIFVS